MGYKNGSWISSIFEVCIILYIYHLIACLKWVYLSNLGIETSLKHSVNQFWWDNLPPPQWYGTPALSPQKNNLHTISSIAAFQSHDLPFACYLQYFRATTFHVQPMCSILEPYTSYQIPRHYLCTTCMLSTYYLHLCIFSAYIRPIACL